MESANGMSEETDLLPVAAPEAGERRRFPRIALSLAATIHAGGRKVHARTLDCSMGGAALFVSTPLDVSGMPVRLSLEHQGHSLDVRARMRHCTVREPGFAVGFEFLAWEVGDEQILASLLDGQYRRTSVRPPVAVRLRYKGLSRQEVYHLADSTDVSCGGVRFEINSEMFVGERLEVTLVLPPERISRVGSVVRIDGEDDKRYAAVCFDPASAVQEEELTTAILRQMS